VNVVGDGTVSLTPDLVGSAAHRLSDAIAARDVSCVEVVSAHLDRIKALDDTYHTMVSLRPRDEVLAEANERDRELARGERRGWMHGLPHAVKDLSDVRGQPTTAGFTPLERAPLATQDSLFVGRLREAGAVFIGKTNTPEFGLGSHTYNAIGPTTRNAVAPDRSAGGSSGGAAVAVALGMVPVADGSDFMGSLRNPPGWNEVLGLRPSAGRVPDLDEDPFTVPGGVVGPVARNVRDLALLLATMAGHDVRVPLSLTDDPQLLVSDLGRPTKTPLIGWLGDLGEYVPTDSGILESCRRWLQRWVDVGAIVEPTTLPAAAGYSGVGDLWPAWLTFRHLQVGGALAPVYSDPRARTRMSPPAVWEVEGFRGLTVADVTASAAVRSGLYRSFLSLFERFDLLALPTAQTWPFAVELDWPHSIGGRPMDTYHRWMEVTTPATMAGLPVLAAPAGRGADGLPIGVQLIARPRDEGRLLRIAAVAEAHGLFDVMSHPSHV
jgi:amidase